jgi:tRNA(fMet)-specific endonuclease VapC
LVTVFLLDTNSWIVYLKSAESKVRQKLARLTPSDIAVCSVVKAELWHGAQKYGNPERRMAIVNQLLAPYQSYFFDDVSARAYARIRHELEVKGEVIGPNDLMIAAISEAHGLILVTTDTNEFSRVPNLRVENWV